MQTSMRLHSMAWSARPQLLTENAAWFRSVSEIARVVVAKYVVPGRKPTRN